MEPHLERVAEDVERLELRTPTVPPATTTNTWFLERSGAFYVVEPATPYDEERAVLFECIASRIAKGSVLLGALLTHHHPDHVGAANALRNEFRVPLFAHARTRDKLQGRIAIDQLLDEGDTLFDGAVRVLHTPGHAPGHLCFFEQNAAWLVAGDMVASVGTIVIDPLDDGDMTKYLRELERLAALAPKQLLPAHGAAITEAVERLRFYVAHRLKREARVLQSVREHPGTLEALVPFAYDDTPPMLWPLAERSALAHLRKLQLDGKVRCEEEHWRAV